MMILHPFVYHFLSLIRKGEFFMQGTTHKAVGAVAAILAIKGMFPDAQPEQLFGAAVIGALGGLIPDIDHPKSTISKKAKPVSAVVSTVCRHRGLFHTPIFYLVLWALVRAAGFPLMYLWDSLFIGIAAHLAFDFLTPSGIPLFFPIHKDNFHFIGLRTSGIADRCIGIVAMTILILYFCTVLISSLRLV